MTPSINSLIVDDHPAIFRGVSYMLETHTNYAHCCTHAKNGTTALQLLDERKIDLVILDVQMRGMNGIEVLKKIKQKKVNIPVMMMTFEVNQNVIKNAISLGVNGFVSKKIESNELEIAVSKLIDGGQYFGQEVANIIMEISLKKTTSSVKNQTLTGRELEILELLSQDLTQNEISIRLNISPRTVEGHARSLRSKLGAKSSGGMVMSALRMGLI